MYLDSKVISLSSKEFLSSTFNSIAKVVVSSSTLDTIKCESKHANSVSSYF